MPHNGKKPASGEDQYSHTPIGADVALERTLAKEEAKPYDVAGQMFAWEDGQLSEDETIILFQHLVDSGLAWQLQGMYGRQANALIEAGLVKTRGRHLREERD